MRCKAHCSKLTASLVGLAIAALSLTMPHPVWSQQEPPSPSEELRVPNPDADADADAAVQDKTASLGIIVTQSPTTGVLVEDVLPESAAAKAGLQPGDYILSFEGQAVNAPRQLASLMAEKKPGQKVRLTLWRGGQRKVVQAALDERQSASYPDAPPAEQKPVRPGARANRAWLGVILESHEASGARIEQIHPDSPAAKAGLQVGDVIVQFGKHKVTSPRDALQAIEDMNPESKVDITVRRDGKNQSFKVQLGSRADFVRAKQPSVPEFAPPRAKRPGELVPAPNPAKNLQQERQLAKQQQRLEQSLRELRKEVQKLRKEVEKLKNQKD